MGHCIIVKWWEFIVKFTRDAVEWAEHAVGAVVPIDAPFVEDQKDHVAKQAERESHHGKTFEKEVLSLPEIFNTFKQSILKKKIYK